MSRLFQPWQLLVTILAGWMTEQQQQLIEYLRTENRVLKELHGKKRLLLTDDQRRRLAVPGKALGRKLLCQIVSVPRTPVSPLGRTRSWWITLELAPKPGGGGKA